MSGDPFDPETLPGELAIFPLSGVLLPRGLLPLNVFEPRYLNMVNAALAGGRAIGMVQPTDAARESGIGVGDEAPVYTVGCMGRIVSFQETDDGRFLITLKGVCRYEIREELPLRDGYRRVVPDFSGFRSDLTERREGGTDRVRLIADLKAYFEQQGIEANWAAIEQTSDERLVTTLAMVCPFETHEKQALPEAEPGAAGEADDRPDRGGIAQRRRHERGGQTLDAKTRPRGTRHESAQVRGRSETA